MRHGVILVLCIAVLQACIPARRAELSDTVAARPSAIVRGLEGGLIGRAGIENLSRADAEQALEAEYRALEYGEAGVPIPWGSGPVKGSVVAAQPYRVGSQDRRSYVQRIQSAAGERTLRGTACRTPDGSWTPLT